MLLVIMLYNKKLPLNLLMYIKHHTTDVFSNQTTGFKTFHNKGILQ